MLWNLCTVVFVVPRSPRSCSIHFTRPQRENRHMQLKFNRPCVNPVKVITMCLQIAKLLERQTLSDNDIRSPSSTFSETFQSVYIMNFKLRANYIKLLSPSRCFFEHDDRLFTSCIINLDFLFDSISLFIGFR